MDDINDDNLSMRCKSACAEADEILHRNGPVAYINLIMEVAADSANHGYMRNAESSIEKAVQELMRCGGSRDVREALAKGYKDVAESITNSRHFPYFQKEYSKYAQRFTRRANELLQKENGNK